MPQAKKPSLVQGVLTLGDIYLTLGWVAIQRLRHGPLWPWDVRPKKAAPIVTLQPLESEGLEEREAVTPKPPSGAT